MAGNCRPSADLVEMTEYTYIGGSTYSGNGSGLINGSAPDGQWNGNTVCYWSGTSDYVKFKFDKPCYIWRTGTSDWAFRTGTLKITNNDTNKDVTSDVTLKSPGTIDNKSWEKIYYISSPGTYTFSYNKDYRIDGEWFFESATGLVSVYNENDEVISEYMTEASTNLLELDRLSKMDLYIQGKVLIGFTDDKDTEKIITEPIYLLPGEQMSIYPVFKELSELLTTPRPADIATMVINRRK